MQLAIPDVQALSTSIPKSNQDVLSELLITKMIEEDIFGHAGEFETLQLNQALRESARLYQQCRRRFPYSPPPPKHHFEDQVVLDAAYAQELQNEETQIFLDQEFAQRLRDTDDTPSTDSGQETDSSELDNLPEHNVTVTVNSGKGKARAGNEVTRRSGLHPTCGICMEPFQFSQSPLAASRSANSSSRMPFGLRLLCPAAHAYCRSCLELYIKSKLDPEGDGKTSSSRVVFPIKCPECPITKWPEGISDDVAERVLEDTVPWHHQKILDSIPKNYCPNPRCSALIQIGNETRSMREKCPSCHVALCVPCWALWHEKMTCEEYQALPLDERSPEDRQTIKLMKAKNWRRCPSCSAIVEHHLGCNHMTCLCSAQFCYRCGCIWDPVLGKCARDPPCNMWDESIFREGEENRPEPVADRRRSSRIFHFITSRILQRNR